MAIMMLGAGEDIRHGPSIAASPTGKLHAVWRGSDGGINYRRWRGGVWEAAMLLPAAAADNYHPAIAVNASGNAFAVFTTRQKDIDPNTYSVFFTRRKGKSWTPARQVSREPYAQLPRLAIGADGVIHIVYSSSPSGQLGKIYYTRGDGEQWLTPISPSGWAGLRPEIAVDSKGAPHLVWNAPDDPYGILYVRAQGNGWAPPLEVANGMHQQVPALAIDGQDRVHITWTKGDNNTLGYAQIKDGVKTMQLNNAQGGALKLSYWSRVTTDCLNHAHVAFQGKLDANQPWQVYERVFDGTNWGSPALVDAPGQSSPLQVPDISAGGNLLGAVWWNSGQNEIRASVETLDCGGVLSPTPPDLEDDD